MRKIKFNSVDHICLIGGGDLIYQVAIMARKKGFEVSLILAPRHADECLSQTNKSLRESLQDKNFIFHILIDINDRNNFSKILNPAKISLAICFGPAWIFSEYVRTQFQAGMLNFNGIPVPKYLGGAHYTWQILNSDKSGGNVLQEITEDIDKGPILKSDYYELSSSAKIPADYFQENYSKSIKFIECFLDEMTSGKEFCPIDFTKLINDRLYFPRLFTSENAYINWQWSIEEIERFICAFDAPYQGASTFIDNKRVYLSSVSLDTEIDMHPYTAGLIVQLNNNQVLVATSGGLLRVKSIIYDGGNSVIPNLKEGMRFHTPTNYIEQGLMYKPELNAQGFVKND